MMMHACTLTLSIFILKYNYDYENALQKSNSTNSRDLEDWMQKDCWVLIEFSVFTLLFLKCILVIVKQPLTVFFQAGYWSSGASVKKYGNNQLY